MEMIESIVWVMTGFSLTLVTMEVGWRLTRKVSITSRTFFMTKFQKEIKNMRILSSFAKEVYLILDIISLTR
jgi:hypothetical protein